VDDIFMIPSTS